MVKLIYTAAVLKEAIFKCKGIKTQLVKEGSEVEVEDEIYENELKHDANWKKAGTKTTKSKLKGDK